jgi:hypothetical protein
MGLEDYWLLAVVLAGVISALNAALNFSLHQLHLRRAGGSSKVASATLDSLRQAEIHEYPPQRHKWSVTARKEKQTPILCVECTDTIKPYIIASAVRRCTRCGVSVHDECLKHVKDSCRPLATEVYPQPHFWLVCGTTFGREEGPGDARTDEPSKLDISPSASASGSAQEHSCIFCKQAVERIQRSNARSTRPSTSSLPAEPTWFCGHCGCYTHVGCFMQYHESAPHLSIVSKAYRREMVRQGLEEAFDRRVMVGGEGRGGHEHESSEYGCGLGTRCKLFALPSSSVRAVKDGRTLGRAPMPKGTMHGVSARQQHSQSQPQMILGNSRPAKPSSKTKPSMSNNRSSARKKKRAWWKRVFSSETLDWNRWQIMPQSLPPNCRPILVYINVKSGPQVGTILRDQFSRLLHPLQVVTLPRSDPMPALRTFSRVPNLRIAIVGGDGTIGWIISCVEMLKRELNSNCKHPFSSWTPPPIAIMPVGTGNDLARCLGWGSGYNEWKSKGISNALNEILHANVRQLDRWELRFSPQADSLQRNDSLMDKAIGLITPRRSDINQRRGSGFDFEQKFMNNYLGVGVDARVAGLFHNIRESHPHLFQSQIGNKLVYTGMGALDVVGAVGDKLDLSSKVMLICDDERIELPKCQGILVVNIASYMGGIDVWQQSEGSVEKREQSMSDGLLEVLAVYGSFHLGKLTVGLSRATRISQASRIQLITTERIPMQIDGEPFRQDPCVIDIEWSSKTAMLEPIS